MGLLRKPSFLRWMILSFYLIFPIVSDCFPLWDFYYLFFNQQLNETEAFFVFTLNNVRELCHCYIEKCDHFKWLFSKSILTNRTIFEGTLLHLLTKLLRLTIIYLLNFLIFIPTILFLKLHINILTDLYWEFISWLSSGEEASK